YKSLALVLHNKRVSAATKFAKQVETDLKAVALEKARFEVRIEESGQLREDGTDRIEFYFSANPGEPVRPLARVASGGEASRLMLVLKTIANPSKFPRTIVFDEIDAGIGRRVSEVVAAKAKKPSATNQVLFVAHPPQRARF